VLYRAPDTEPTLPPSILDKSKLFMVRFANGTKEVFSIQNADPANSAPRDVANNSSFPTGPDGLTLVQRDQLRQRGAEDALKLGNYSGAFWGTYAATVVTFYGGPIVMAGVSLARPRAERNMRLDRTMLRYPAYVDGYERQAQKRKFGQSAKGFGAGVGTLVALVVLLIAASTP
jgi:hypothetical protein